MRHILAPAGSRLEFRSRTEARIPSRFLVRRRLAGDDAWTTFKIARGGVTVVVGPENLTWEYDVGGEEFGLLGLALAGWRGMPRERVSHPTSSRWVYEYDDSGGHVDCNDLVVTADLFRSPIDWDAFAANARATDETGRTERSSSPVVVTVVGAFASPSTIVAHEDVSGRALLCDEGVIAFEPGAPGRLLLKPDAVVGLVTFTTARRLREELRGTARRAEVSFRANGEGTVAYDGRVAPCLGLPGLRYAQDLTVTGTVGVDKFESKYSSEFGVQMAWAVLLMGARGIYMHEGPADLVANAGPTAGCIHLEPTDARTFYDWVTGPTRILISYPW